MLLAIDVGNTNITFGLFDRKKLVKKCRMKNAECKINVFNETIDAIIISSVVPKIDKKLRADCRKYFGLKPHFVTAENISGIKVKVKNKKEVGADRVVDALAAFKLYGGPCIVVDFGTATTFDVISGKGEYLGGAIALGISLARDALYSQTAKLPKVEIKAPKNVVGNDTVSAMQSGLVYGYVAMVEGMVQKLQTANLKLQGNSKQKTSKMKIISTGGYAPLICKYTKVVDTIDQDLTLKGLQMIGERNALVI